MRKDVFLSLSLSLRTWHGIRAWSVDPFSWSTVVDDQERVVTSIDDYWVVSEMVSRWSTTSIDDYSVRYFWVIINTHRRLLYDHCTTSLIIGDHRLTTVGSPVTCTNSGELFSDHREFFSCSKLLGFLCFVSLEFYQATLPCFTVVVDPPQISVASVSSLAIADHCTTFI